MTCLFLLEGCRIVTSILKFQVDTPSCADRYNIMGPFNLENYILHFSATVLGYLVYISSFLIALFSLSYSYYLGAVHRVFVIHLLIFSLHFLSL